MIKVKTVDQNKADSDVTPALRHQSIRYFTLLNQPPPPSLAGKGFSLFGLSI